MQNVSAFGTKATIVALQTFPFGFSVSKFADDEDPVKVEAIEPVGYELLIDGSLFAYDKGAAIKVSLSVIAGSADDINLKILLQAKKGAASIIPLPDTTSIILQYPNGLVIFSSGTILSGPLADSIKQEGRFKGNTYTFVFGSFSGAQTATELVVDITRSIAGLL